jgi:hypothetical protein
MAAGELTQLSGMHYDDKQGFLNWIEKRMSILEAKWTRKIRY